MNVTAIEQPISQLIQNIVGSNLEYAGFLALLFFVLAAVWYGLDLTIGLLVFVPLILVLASAGVLPAWVVIPVALILIVMVAAAIRAYTER